MDLEEDEEEEEELPLEATRADTADSANSAEVGETGADKMVSAEVGTWEAVGGGYRRENHVFC